MRWKFALSSAVAHLVLVRCNEASAIPFLRRYVFDIAASVYWAWLAAHYVKRIMPPATIPTFIIVVVIGLSLGTFRLTALLHAGKPSGVSFFCFVLGLFSIAYAAILIVGGIIEHYIADSWGYIFDWYGFVFAGTYAIALTSYMIHQHALEEDEKHPRVADPEGDAREHRKYMHPYI